MALNLVPYGDSDAESDSDDGNGSSLGESSNKRPRSSSDTCDDPLPRKKFLPDDGVVSGKPSGHDPTLSVLGSQETNNHASGDSKLLASSVIVDKESKKITISLPSLEDFEYESSDDELDTKTIIKPTSSPAGSCSLLSMLPKPQNTSSISSTTLSFVPHTLTKSKPQPPKTVPIARNDSLRQPSSVPSEFFLDDDSCNDKEYIKPTSSNIALVKPAPAPDPELSYNDILMKKLAEDGQLSASDDEEIAEDNRESLKEHKTKKSAIPADLDINDPAYKKLIAKKFGEETPDQINIVDVNVSQYLRQNNEYIKSISMERQSEPNEPAPNSTARRKHQITYLAYQAKQREIDLKNQAAANRLTKSQSRARYGF